MSTTYITLTTCSLISLTGKTTQDKINWNEIGTSIETINLSNIKYNGVSVEGILYVLPVDNTEQATVFINRIYNDYGITAELVNEETAIGLIAQYKAVMEV
jgi:hypothetical protein